MEVNWTTIAILAILALILIVFLVRRNLKDKKDLEVFLNKNEDLIKEEEEELNDTL
jgi:hypothetical protein